jgi:salicylate hydroxylase
VSQLQHGDLRRLLYDTAISYGAKVRRGAYVVDIDANKRAVKLANGQVLRADVIIGADGLSSIARRQLLESEGKSDDNAPSNGLVMYK